MTKILLVARWEFVRTVTRRAYIIVVAAMPIFYACVLGVAALGARTIVRQTRARTVGIVDGAHVVDLQRATQLAAAYTTRDGSEAAAPAFQGAERLAAYDDEQTALAALRRGEIVSVYVIAPDYLASGAVTSYSRDAGLFALPAERRRQTQVADAIRGSLLGAVAGGDRLARIYAPAANLTRLHVDAQGRVEADGGVGSSLGPFAGPFGVYLMLTMAIFFSAGFLQQATAEDRQNRMIEILMSSLDPDELVIGKIIGLSGAGLLQLAVYVGLVIVPGMTVLAIFKVPLWSLALSLVYFAIGYTLFACLMAGTGAVGRTSQESAQLSTIWTLLSASPLFFLAPISAAPNGLLARALSFFPLTSAVTMMLRLSSGEVPGIDIAISIAVGVAAIYAALRGATKLFRVAALMYGQRPTLPSIIRVLRSE